MRTIFLIAGLVIAGIAMFISTWGKFGGGTTKPVKSKLSATSPEFIWTQVAPSGAGTDQHEWKPGTYPSGIVPLLAINDDLWMIGQKRSWSSSDGITWRAYDKTDWGEKISTAIIFFNGKLWLFGGMEYKSSTMLNDVWSSEDGRTWTRIVANAEWSARKGHTVAVFDNKLWLFGGAVGVDEDKVANKFVNDIWSSGDGKIWTKVSDSAPWTARDNPRILSFKGRMWMVGGQGHSDIWNSSDGKDWLQVKKTSPWGNRYDYGALVFDNLMWIIGGRKSDPRSAYRDVWYSIDGSDWQLQADHAPWSPRSGGNSAVFEDKLWLYGGKHTGHQDSFSGDIWTMESAQNR